MMETYNLRAPEEEVVSDFEYVYPDTLDIDNNIFIHLGFGLYMISKEDTINKLTADSVAKYHRLHFSGFHEDILFAYSKMYSCWDEEMIKWCLNENFSILKVPQELVSKVNYVIAKIKKAEAEDNWRESLISCCDVWSVSEERVELDAVFDFSNERKQDKYIMLKGKVGTRVADGVYKFKAPFQVNIQESGKMDCYGVQENFMPSISCYENVINTDCVVLYEEVWSGGTLSVLEYLIIHYLSFDKNSEYLNRVADFYDLKIKEFRRLDKPINNEPLRADADQIIEEMEEEKDNSPKADIEARFREMGYKEVFNNLGYKGDWLITYLKLFDFNRRPQTMKAEYVAFTEKGIIHCYGRDKSVDDADVLPYDMLKYLRIDLRVPCGWACEQIDNRGWRGHTFISMNDDKENALVGVENVQLLKKLR